MHGVAKLKTSFRKFLTTINDIISTVLHSLINTDAGSRTFPHKKSKRGRWILCFPYDNIRENPRSLVFLPFAFAVPPVYRLISPWSLLHCIHRHLRPMEIHLGRYMRVKHFARFVVIVLSRASHLSVFAVRTICEGISFPWCARGAEAFCYSTVK